MRKLLCAMLSAVMLLSSVSMAKESELKIEDAAAINAVSISGGVIRGIERKGCFAFKDVDLTGVNSIEVGAWAEFSSSSNGETLLVIADDPDTGKVIGSLTFSESGEAVSAKTAIEPLSGKHDLYFYCLYGSGLGNTFRINKVLLSDEKYVNTAGDKKVPDSSVADVWSDTWAAVDDMGRKVADYEETGAVKDGAHDVGIMYWNWFSKGVARATVISDIINKDPSAKDDYYNENWDPQGRYYWSEPLLGFYFSNEYWLVRKHAEMLANAGVDAVFFDYTNDGATYLKALDAFAAALRDAKASGVNIPKMSAVMSLSSEGIYAVRGLGSIYYNCFVKNDYSDIWYYRDGKPFLFGNCGYEYAEKELSGNAEKTAMKEASDFFTIRKQGKRNDEKDGEMGSDAWMWLENFPQILRNPDETGRPEFMSVGTAINQSTVYGLGTTGAFSDPYCKGRGYSEAFGEDYRDIAKKEAYFFREQAALALEADPEFVFIDGWNEWTTIRNQVYGNYQNAFVDLYDDENSRDFEPSRGALGDSYYNLLCDFVRKYKGVRPARTATGARTVDITLGEAAWEGIGPEYLNNSQNYLRDSDGLGKARSIAGETIEPWHYKTTVNNAIKSAKVSYDSENIYFLVKTEEDIKEGTDNWMNLYINSDRNYATGWEGYDYAVNLAKPGEVSSYNGSWSAVGNASYSVNGKCLTVAVPRALIGITGEPEFEFKWTDGVSGNDILNFYKDGSSAPLGRFNYVYTVREQTALSASERSALSGVTVLKAGNNRMSVSGGKMFVYEPDTRITPFEENGTLYVPLEAFNEIMGYGRAKTRYEAADNMLLTYHFDMNPELTKIENYTWTFGVLWSNEININGKTAYLSHPAIARNNMVYIPLTMLNECYGISVKSLGNGIYQVGDAESGAVEAAIRHIG